MNQIENFLRGYKYNNEGKRSEKRKNSSRVASEKFWGWVKN
jgi:hypothetical protein